MSNNALPEHQTFACDDIEKLPTINSDNETTFIPTTCGILDTIRNKGTLLFNTDNSIAAAFIILQEAGSKVTDINGKPWHPGVHTLISARTEEDYEAIRKLYKDVS